MFLTLFHLSVFLLNSYCLWYDQVYVDLPYPSKEYADMSFKARTVFLTIWGIAFQTLFFAVAFLNDIFGTNDLKPARTPVIRKIKDIMFSLAFPLATYVCIMFWSIYAYDKEMILPDYIQKVLPSWCNHTVHTLVFVFIVIEFIACSRIYPSRFLGLFVFYAFNGLYFVWFLRIYLKSGIWPYPIFEHLTWVQRIFFFTLSNAACVIIYIFGEKLNALLRSSSVKVKSR